LVTEFLIQFCFTLQSCKPDIATLHPGRFDPISRPCNGAAGQAWLSAPQDQEMKAMTGIHHVTAIASDAAANLAFYRDVLGLRLIKTTVNFDDPGTYHLYFGDETGQPGTVLTFFPHSGAARGRVGVGQVAETAFAVPAGSLGFWTERFIAHNVTFSTPEKRFGETVLPFEDRDGTRLALVALPAADGIAGWSGAGVPADAAIRGIRGVTLWVSKADGSARVLEEALGYRRVGEDGRTIRYSSDGAEIAPVIGGAVDLRVVGDFLPGRMGAGSVHHVAFRASTDADQARMSQALRSALGISATEQLDRQYFRSIYFREPSGVIFEIATDAPGFATDEPMEHLGETLKLPAWLEPHRAEIEAALPALSLTREAA
jgi:glyoxalase family protein